MTQKITILDDYQHVIETLDCYKMLDGLDVQILHHTETDAAKLATLLHDSQILVLTRERTAITDALLKQLPNLKLISQTGKISNHLNLATCIQYGVAVAEGVGSPIAPAELTWALIMNTVRQIPPAMSGMQQGKWQTNMGQIIHGKTLGIWGYGKIGQRLAQYAKAFGANVLVWGSETSMQKAVTDGFIRAASKADFFTTSDIITLNLRLNPATTGIVTEQDLMMMKDGATLINTARAELIAPNALLNTLKSGKNIFVGVDVYEQEPIYDPNYPLLAYSNVVCTPHIGYVEKDSYELYFSKAFENVLNFIQGQPSNISNPEVLKFL